jgi:hypothetical protein
MKRWIEINLPFGPLYDDDFKEKDGFGTRGLKKPGTLIETARGVFLIGHINEGAGVCNDCVEFEPEEIVLRYKVVWKEEDELADGNSENPFVPAGK